MAAAWVSRRSFAIILAVFSLACIPVPRGDEGAPPSAAAHACPTDSVTGQSGTESNEFHTPTRRLYGAEIPAILDDLDFADMDLVVARQLDRFSQKKLSGYIWFGQDRYPLRAVRDSLVQFRRLVREERVCRKLKGEERRADCLIDFANHVKEKFALYTPALTKEDPRFGEPEPVLYTGYYTPLLEVSLKPEGEFKHPIYSQPTDEWVSRMGRFEIDFRQGLAGRGLELFYAKDLFDLYLLHLEGGGRVTFRDAKGRAQSLYLSYGGSNGRQWRFISTRMLDKNWISDPAIPDQREFIDSNPQLVPEIFSYCPSYVFFKTTNHQPEGSDQVPLTDNRSIATDKKHYGFKGTLAYVRTRRPRELNKDIDLMPFSRFVLDQDTGSAIRGKGRVDFYFGEGDYAELAANTMKQRGDLYFLILKPEVISP